MTCKASKFEGTTFTPSTRLKKKKRYVSNFFENHIYAKFYRNQVIDVLKLCRDLFARNNSIAIRQSVELFWCQCGRGITRSHVRYSRLNFSRTRSQ